MNKDTLSKISSVKYESLLDSLINNNGTISIDDIKNAYELLGDNFDVKVEFPNKTYKMNLRTLINMKENGFKINVGVHELSINRIVKIFLDKKEYKMLIDYMKGL